MRRIVNGDVSVVMAELDDLLSCVSTSHTCPVYSHVPGDALPPYAEIVSVAAAWSAAGEADDWQGFEITVFLGVLARSVIGASILVSAMRMKVGRGLTLADGRLIRCRVIEERVIMNDPVILADGGVGVRGALTLQFLLSD